MKVKVSEIQPNKTNPRDIDEEMLDKLVKSIQEFPEMLAARPLVIDEDFVVLGGNQRLKALKIAGIDKVEVLQVTDWSEAQKKEFIVKDNLSYGTWDYDLLRQDFDIKTLDDYGLIVPEVDEDVDYSILEDEDEDPANFEDRQKTILIEFRREDYEEAYELVKDYKKRDVYIGGKLLEYLRNKKKDYEAK